MIRKLIRKTVFYLRKEGIKETLYITYNFLVRQIRIRKVRSTDYLEIKTKASERSCLTEKVSTTVNIVTAIPYYDIGGGQRAAQLAKTFNQMGYRVRYFYAEHSYDKKIDKVLIPTEVHMEITDKSISYLRENVNEKDLFVFESPLVEFEPILDIAVANRCKIIYENIDNWETSLGSRFFNERMLKKILASADVLSGTAQPLVKQLEEYLKRYDLGEKKILYLANAVDDILFCGLKELKKPDDLVLGKQTLLYYGTLWGEWFDWKLLCDLAKRHPEYAINLIGNAERLQKKIRECPKNIYFLGLKAQKDLPAYLQYVDYAMIPFKRGEIGDYVSPLKIFEYIAMYTKVLCTTLPDVTGYPNVYFGDTSEEWEAVIEGNHETDREAADHFVNQNTWFHRVSNMLEHTIGKKESLLKDKLAIVVSNYNNKHVVFKCINSLLAYNERYGYKIIVVDNGSTDGSYELLCDKYSSEQVEIYKQDGKCDSLGKIVGASKTDREYLLFLDSNQWTSNTEWLRPYEEVMTIHPDFGAIGCTGDVYNGSGNEYSNVDSFPYRYMYPNMLCRSDVAHLGSGGVLFKKKNFYSVESFEAHCNSDCSFRIKNTGKELYYCPYLGVFHLPHQITESETL